MDVTSAVWHLPCIGTVWRASCKSVLSPWSLSALTELSCHPYSYTINLAASIQHAGFTSFRLIPFLEAVGKNPIQNSIHILLTSVKIYSLIVNISRAYYYYWQCGIYYGFSSPWCTYRAADGAAVGTMHVTEASTYNQTVPAARWSWTTAYELTAVVSNSSSSNCSRSADPV